ncbi:MAG: ACT domain-containing protein, partial [Armatimonadota bacterium]
AARDHCEAGADVAGRVAERLGFAPGRCEQLRDLIRKHLFLARTARLEDVALPGTIQRFAQRIGDVETLHMLFVLTYADTLAVTPAAWSDVTRQQTEDLYFRTLKLLLSGMSDEEVAQQIQRVREQVIRRLAAGARVAEARARAHCEAMPDSYLVHTPVGTIAQHIAFAERLPREGPILEFYDGPGQDFTELTICCRDDPEPGLFAKIAGVLYANDINVHTAQIYTRSSDDIVFDVLWIDFHGRQVTSAKRATLTRELIETFTGRTSVAELLDKKRKREPEPLDVAVLRASNQISEDHTVVQVTAEDQPGLLYRVTQALAACGLDIHTAKITTWRGKAEDAFYVTDADGGQVAEEILQEVEGRLRSLLVRK